MDWTILGIAPTDDKKAITAAYRAKLKTTNPEEKPEQFKALRAAYEEALRLADQVKEAPVRDESPVGLWMERIADLYNDFPARITAENWHALLQDDVCSGLDTRPLVEEALLKFLMERYYIPRSVWQVLDAAFSWMERTEELCESYPRDFIEQCVLNGIRFEQSLGFDLFEPGLDAESCDEYRRLYYQYNQTPPDQRSELLDRMESLPEQHPYGRALRCRWLLDNGMEEEARAGFRELARRHPSDPMLSLDHAALCIRSGETDEAEAAVEGVLDSIPDHLYARRLKAECQAARGQLADAKETLYDAMNIAGDDPSVMEQLAGRIRSWNTELIARYEAALAEDPDDSKTALDLAWCHLQCERPDTAMDIALKIDEGSTDPFDYHNLMGKLYYNIEMFSDAGQHMERVVDILRCLEPDGTQKTDKRIRRLPEMLQLLGSCLMQTGETERAQAVLAEALTLAPDDPKILSVMANIHHSSGKYEDCITVLDHLLDVSPGSWYGHLMRSICCYRLRRDGEAFDSVNRAMSLHGGDLSIYILKMQILLRNGVFEEVRNILDFLREAGAPEDIGIDFVRAQLLELEAKDTAAAFRAYQAIARRVEDGEEFFGAASLYYHMTCIMGDRSENKTKDDTDALFATLEKGLAQDPNDSDCLNYKAWLLRRTGRLSEAIELYQTKPILNARRKLADTYFDDQDTYGREALALYEELLREQQTPELCFYAATAARHLGEFDKTDYYSGLALSLDPDDIDAHRARSFLLERQGEYEAALAHLDKALAVMENLDLFYDWLLNHKLRVLRRMGRHAEALAAIDDAMSRSGYNGWQMKFDICCQFGLFDQAEVVLDQWDRAQKDNPDVTKATGQLHLYRGKLLKATVAYGKVKHKMDREDQLGLRCQLAELEVNTKRLVQLWTERLEIHYSRYNGLMHLALALRWSGDVEQSEKYAAEALPLVEEKLKSFCDDELIHRTCHALLLMLAGREDEARAELEACRKRPLCEFCSYGACKDADIFEAYIEELAGNHARAKELYQKGRKNWPDELDFVSGENRMKKKKGT